MDKNNDEYYILDSNISSITARILTPASTWVEEKFQKSTWAKTLGGQATTT